MGRPRHGYTLADGTPVPGVTTITGLLNKPALVGWAGKTMHAAATEHGKLCYAAGKAGARFPGFPKWTDTLYGQRDAAADAGTQAHDMFELHLRGEAVDVDQYSPEAGQAFRNAQEWLEQSNLLISPHERPLVSEKHRFGGTPDATAIGTGGRVYLADWKTGGFYGDMLCQLGAYAALLLECGNVRVSGAHLVRFPREGQAFHHHYVDASLLQRGLDAFFLLRQLYDIKPELDKAAK